MAKKDPSKMTNEERIKEIKESRAREEAREIKESKDQENVELEKQRLQILIAQKKAIGEVNNARQLEFELLKKLQDFTEMAVVSETELNDLKTQAAAENDEAKQKELEKQIETIEGIIKAKESYKELVEQLEENTKGTEKLSKAQLEAKESLDSTFEGLATKVGINSKAFNTFAEGMAKMVKQMKENPKQVKQSIRDSFLNPMKIAGAAMAQMVEATMQLALATENATAQFAAQTGAGRAMTAQIYEMTAANRHLGVSAESAGKAYGALFEGFTGFMGAGEKAQKELGATVAQLERIGVDGATAAKSLTLFNMNMGMSLKDSQKLTKQLAMMGTKIGISSKKMVSGFVEASKSLAVYGKEAVKVFRDLAAQAKAANVETSTLLGVAEKFDTFSGAADAAGKLNSILGTQISATEMLTMKENERIETLIRSIQAQGRSFKDMDRFSQKAIANAAGITDMAEAQRIFGMSVADYRKGLRPDPKEEEFQKALKDTMTIMEKLKRIGQQFAISMNPFLDGIARFVQGVLDFNAETNGYFIPTMAALLGTLVFVPKIVGLFTAFFGMFATAAPASVPGITIFSKALARSAPAFLQGSLGLLAVGAALVVMGLGFAAMGSAFGGNMTGGSVFQFLVGLAGGLIALGAGFYVLGAMVFGPQGLLFAAGLAAAAASIVTLGLALATINLEKTKAMGALISSLSGGMEVNTRFTAIADLKDFTDQMIEKEATLKPMLGDLALIATGKTTQDIKTNTAQYNLNTFSANLENIFKPTIVIEIDGEELTSRTKKIINEEAKGE